MCLDVHGMVCWRGWAVEALERREDLRVGVRLQRRAHERAVLGDDQERARREALDGRVRGAHRFFVCLAFGAAALVAATSLYLLRRRNTSRAEIAVATGRGGALPLCRRGCGGTGSGAGSGGTRAAAWDQLSLQPHRTARAVLRLG